MRTEHILGYDIFSGSVGDCSQSIATAFDSDDGQCRWLACLNPHSYVVAQRDESFFSALKRADWIIPDGIGIVLAGRILGRPLTERITGFDVFDGVMRKLNERSGSVFFLGSTRDNLMLISQKLHEDYPNVKLVGTYSPPFKNDFSEEDNIKMINEIVSVRPDVLWVGMTAPKQEKWIADMRSELPVRFVGAIGAVFDFYSGNVARSHPFFREVGLEWLPRLLKEPKRLWRRMGISAPLFILDVLLCLPSYRKKHRR